MLVHATSLVWHKPPGPNPLTMAGWTGTTYCIGRTQTTRTNLELASSSKSTSEERLMDDWCFAIILNISQKKTRPNRWHFFLNKKTGRYDSKLYFPEEGSCRLTQNQRPKFKKRLIKQWNNPWKKNIFTNLLWYWCEHLDGQALQSSLCDWPSPTWTQASPPPCMRPIHR